MTSVTTAHTTAVSVTVLHAPRFTATDVDTTPLMVITVVDAHSARIPVRTVEAMAVAAASVHEAVAHITEAIAEEAASVHKAVAARTVHSAEAVRSEVEAIAAAEASMAVAVAEAAEAMAAARSAVIVKQRTSAFIIRCTSRMVQPA